MRMLRDTARSRALRCATVVFMFAPTAPATLAAQGATWRVSTAPTIRIGNSDALDAVLSAPAGATRLPSGNIVVGDQGDFALREFTPAGRLVKKYGRKGKGPGEITYVFPLLRCGDSLVANDIAGSANVFTVDGTFVRAFRFRPTPYRLSCNSRLQFAMMGSEADQNMKKEPNRSPAAYWLARADTTTTIPLGSFAGAERIAHRPYPLGRDPRVAIGPTRAYVALADSFEVKVFDLQGKPLPSLIARVPRVAATGEDLDAEREREIAMRGEKARKSLELEYATIPLTKFLPATRDLIVDTDGNVWVQHFPRAGAKTVPWTVFSSAGKVLATVALPSPLEVYEVGRDYVLGRYIDPDEAVPEVRLYALTRR